MPVVKCLLLWFCLVSSLLAAKKRPNVKNYLQWEVLEECPGTSYENKMVAAKRNYTGLGIDGTFIINQPDIPLKLNSNFIVKKCKTREDKACEHFMSGTVDFCKVLLDKGQFYTPTFHAIHPRLKCPLKKGVYKVNNATLDSEAMSDLLKFAPPEFKDYHWLLRFTVYAPSKPKKILSCFNVIFRHSYMKNTRT